MNHMQEDLIHILPLLIILLTGVVVLVMEMIRKPSLGLYGLTLGLALASIWTFTHLETNTTVFSQTYRIDALSRWSIIILCPVTILTAWLFRSEFIQQPREGTGYALLIFSALGSVILAGSGDLMFIVIGTLMSSLASLALVVISKSDKSSEGGLKYFVYASVCGAIMIFGLTFWVGASGSTLLSQLPLVESIKPAFIAGFLGLIFGLGYMASIVPFHFWTPDTFEASPISVAAFLSIVPKIGAFFALAQVCSSLPIAEINWPLVLGILAALSMLVGNVMALRQDNLIRLLAYSTVSQAGYFLLAVTSNQVDTGSLIVFGAAYSAMNLGAFSFVKLVGTDLKAMEGVGLKKRFLGICMVVFLLSLVGIPPLAGFAGKFMLFRAAIQHHFLWLAVFGIINSVISLAVYLRIIVPLYRKKEAGNLTDPLSRMAEGIIIISLVLTFVLSGLLYYFW